METERAVKGECVAVSKAKRIRLAFVDIALFAVLFMIFLFLFAMPFAIAFPELKTLAGGASVYLMMLNEVLMLASGLVAACMVLGFRKLPFSGLGLSLKLGAVDVAGGLFSPISLLASLLLYFLVAVTEEVIGRGFILGRMLDGGVNKFVALFVSAVLFSLMHLFNPSFAFVPFLNIMLAGCFLGASYIYTRNLCFPIALHWFWNWIQGSVLGYKVSGNEFSNENLLILHFPEENLINGGTFGFEGSILCSLLLVLGTVIIIRHYNKGGSAINAETTAINP